MTNFQVYKKTLSFSLVGFLIDILALILWGALATLGFVIGNKMNDKGIIGLLIGVVIGIVVLILIKIFVSNVLKAGQVAMMTQGVTEGKLPDKVLHEGRKVVKERFASITAFFFVTGAIKGIFRQITRSINRLGTALGGETGNTITSIIDSGIQILLGYLCDCCLGWVFYRTKIGTARAACEGSAIFFKHGKTLFKNIGRIFGMGLLGLIIVGGAFFGIFYGIFSLVPSAFNSLSLEVAESMTRLEITDMDFLKDPKTLMLVMAGVLAIVLYSMAHSVFIRPFILVGVLRNFTASGIKDIPTEEEFAKLNEKSPKFAKLYGSI